MKLQHVPLNEIAWNPWRDKDLFPISEDQIAKLKGSIKEHGFFSSVKGRRRDGKVEIGCGHARLAAARKAGLDAIPIFVGDMDDDEMLRLMTDENALQSGTNPGAVMNEVAAVTRRLIEGLLREGTIVPPLARAFESKLAVEAARGKLRKGADVHLALGHNVIRRYLGQGNPDNANRGERQVREAISALKQSGKYDDIVEEAIAKYPPPVDKNAKPSKSTAVVKAKEKSPRRRVLDERCVRAFPNDHQFHAFREAVTTSGAQKVIPVSQQYALARDIMDPKQRDGRGSIGAPYIKMKVQTAVQEGLKKQRDIDKEERERYLNEQREGRIDAGLSAANMQLRGLVSSIAKLIDLADEFPHHPKLGGFSARLDTLTNAIQQFSRKLQGK